MTYFFNILLLISLIGYFDLRKNDFDYKSRFELNFSARKNHYLNNQRHKAKFFDLDDCPSRRWIKKYKSRHGLKRCILKYGRYCCVGFDSLKRLAGQSKENRKVSEECLKAFRDKLLEIHNILRKRHGVPKMSLDDNATQFADNYADQLAKNFSFEHSKERLFGENLYLKMSTNRFKLSKSDCESYANSSAMSWYNEISLYNYSNPKINSKNGHFTQMVWKKSTKLGVSLALTKNKDKNGFYRLYVVAEYSPPGNFIGQEKKNILPLLNESNTTSESVDIKKLSSSILNIRPECLNEIRRTALSENNRYRSIHKSGPLELDPMLNIKGQNLSQFLSNTFDFDVLELGSNAAIISQRLPLSDEVSECNYYARLALKTWYDGGKFYDPSLENIDPKSRYYTQMLWAASKKIGIGATLTKIIFSDAPDPISTQDNAFYILILTAIYDPIGNIKNEFEANVKPPSSSQID